MKYKLIKYLLLNITLVVTLFPQELRWNWQHININNIYFPSTFLWGVSDSALQTEGRLGVNNSWINNSWTEFEYQLTKEHVLTSDQCVGKACERWLRYAQDIQLAKSIGVKVYRFSIDWSKIEPQEGHFDHQALQHYIDVVDELLRQNIIPMITLFHHIYPNWFGKKKAFENKNNIFYFTRFASYIFSALHTKVPYWITFNEPIGYALEAYYRGNYPPGKKSLRLAGKVAKHQLNAHVIIFNQCKKINNKAKIGIAHIFNPIDTYHTWNPFEKVAASVFDYVVNDLIIDFFKTGKFSWPLFVHDYNKQAPQSLDFIGINYYTHTLIKHSSLFSIEPAIRPEEKTIGVPSSGRAQKVLYPEGLYRSIQKTAKLCKPMFITENGCATNNANLKEEYIKKHLFVVSQAIKEGHNILGYLYWTLTDGFCWRKGYQEQQGIFAVDFTTQQRTFRPSFQCLVDIMQRFA